MIFFIRQFISDDNYVIFLHRALRPHTLTFIMVFNGTETVSRDLTTQVISTGAPHYNVENLDLMFIGSQFFYLHRGYNNIAINLTDFTTTSAPMTTESPRQSFVL